MKQKSSEERFKADVLNNLVTFKGVSTLKKAVLNYLIRQSKIADVDDENLPNNPFKSLMTEKTA